MPTTTKPDPTSTSLTTLEACHRFVQTQTPSLIAARLLHDQSLCRKGNGVPSLLVYCLPPARDKKSINTIALALSELADPPNEVSNQSSGVGQDGLLPNRTPAPRIPLVVARMRYTSIVASIKAYLANLGDYETQDETTAGTTQLTEEIPQHLIPSDDELHSALKVLRYLQLPQVHHRGPVGRSKGSSSSYMGEIESVMSLIQSQLDLDASTREAERADWKGFGGRRSCYICRYFITSPHHLYPSLCHPCGEFNISSSAISLPNRLNLHNKTALVTGGRVNLGFHTALRLLRCGASVIVTTRYPRDAQTRYVEEPDSMTWGERLKIIGADFRAAKDVFDLVAEVKEVLKEWKSEKLDILINNAAQTLTDSIEEEQGNIRRERILLENHSLRDDQGSVVTATRYEPRVRGGHGVRYITNQRAERLVEGVFDAPDSDDPLTVTKAYKSSWVQDINDIPYEDVISAHSVNTFVPFILLRELLTLLRGPSGNGGTFGRGTWPIAHVINVSSREGIPERKVSSGAKAGHHVHTNMSKAALNMLTETEAANLWKKEKIAINAVDPGYMSADPMWMEMVGKAGEACPIGWEDGAARVLWPIAKGEIDGVPIWGKFLKHFAQVDVSRFG